MKLLDHVVRCLTADQQRNEWKAEYVLSQLRHIRRVAFPDFGADRTTSSHMPGEELTVCFRREYQGRWFHEYQRSHNTR